VFEVSRLYRQRSQIFVSTEVSIRIIGKPKESTAFHDDRGYENRYLRSATTTLISANQGFFSATLETLFPQGVAGLSDSL
jgi:hypothetical protein